MKRTDLFQEKIFSLPALKSGVVIADAGTVKEWAEENGPEVKGQV